MDANSAEASFAMPVAGFRTRKAAQISAWFAVKSGGQVEKLKLIKLIYFAERRFLAKNHFPMLFDEFYSLRNGPICSATLNGINGVIHEGTWQQYVARNGNIVVAIKSFTDDSLDEISREEFGVLDEVWNQLGKKTASQLRNYSHEFCKEYSEVMEGRLPISYRDILEAVGVANADEIDREIVDMRRAESVLFG